MTLIHLQDACLAYGHVPLLDHADLVVERGERVCLVGRNGAGKSTLLQVIAGRRQLDSGSLRRRDGVTIARLAQEVPDAETSTLFEVVAAGLGDQAGLLARYHAASLTLGEGGEAALTAFSRLQAEVEAAGAWEGTQRIEATLDRLGLPADATMAECSGGIRRRAMLGQALVSEPDLLLLDEPTNHLDIDAITSLEEALLAYPGAVLFITHDRALIDRLATRIVELDRGRLRSFPGSYAEYLRRKSELLDAEADADRKFDQSLAEEEVWIRQGIKARRTRNEGRVRRLEAMRRERAERRERQGSVKLQLAGADRSGKLVVEAEDVSFGYDGAPVIRDLSTLILRGDRIGIIGPNGSGKTTLLKLLLGRLTPDSGTIRRGTGLEIAYFDQERAQLDPERSVRDNVADGSDRIDIGGKSRHVVGYLQDFLFPPARVQSPVSSLSGGERNRLLLAKLFARPANLLVLDEPTNDLDVETLELLEEVVADYPGTLLLVSHDRSFLDSTVTSVMAVGADGRVEEHTGGYSDWVRYHAERAEQALPPREVAPPPKSVPAEPKARKLSYKDQRELEALPGRIESLEAELAALQARTADPEFYRQDPQAAAEALRALADVEARLQAAFERWAALEG
ncbi:MAG: ATP-binding cassette domain-containing protein [bacterium]